MNNFDTIQFDTTATRHLLNFEIENLIIRYCDKNNLILIDNFNRHHWEFYSRDTPYNFVEYSIVFKARLKTSDDLLREQIKFQIEQLEK